MKVNGDQLLLDVGGEVLEGLSKDIAIETDMPIAVVMQRDV